MACGECGDPRNLCRCAIAAGDSSVTITGEGSPGDPYLISAPGAGAGTRESDRAAVYDVELDGTYPDKPPDYPHYDFYGPADPALAYPPAQFDGWYRTGRNGLIALLDYGVAQESMLGSSVQLALGAVRNGDVCIVTVAASGGTPVTPAGWTPVINAAIPLTGVYYRVLDAADSGSVHVFSGLLPPVGGYYEIYSGVDSVVLDVPPSAATSGNLDSASLTIPGLATVTPGALLLSAVTVDDATAKLVPPSGMSTINQTAGNTYRHMVATGLQAVAGFSAAKTWSHTPNPPGHKYTGVMIALRPAVTGTYYLWINGRWTMIGGPGGSSSGEDAGGGSGGSSGGGYAITIGDGTHSVFTVVHPLNTLDVLVECVNLSTGQTCYPVVQRTSPTTVYLDFGDTTPASASRRVLITKVG